MKRISLISVKVVKEKTGLYDVPTTKISSPQDAHTIIETVLALNSSTVEKFGILTLNTKNAVVGIHVLTIGSLNTSIVHPRDIFQQALLNNAASIVLFHNHPSGDTTPSREDIDITRKVCAAGEMMGIPVLDHVIVGDGEFKSLRSAGLMGGE